MAQIITNQASIAYRYNDQSASAVSNVATAVINEPLGVSKVSLESVYRLGDDITYVITVTAEATSNPNYTITVESGTFTITPAAITIKNIPKTLFSVPSCIHPAANEPSTAPAMPEIIAGRLFFTSSLPPLRCMANAMTAAGRKDSMFTPWAPL